MSLSTTTRLSLSDCIDLIATTGHLNRYLLRGEKGIGKSAIMKGIAARLGDDYVPIYLDLGSMSDSADLFIPFPNRDEGHFERLISKHLRIPEGKRRIIMLDELTKANRMVLQAVHTLLEVDNRRLGDTKLHPEDIVFGTGNLNEEGVGDNLPDHTRDRMTEIEVRKSTGNEWLVWAADNDIDPPVMAWANETPQLFDSFRDPGFDEDNAYVYNPKKVQRNFVSLRGLELMSHITKGRSNYSRDALIAALAGTGGEPAARSLVNFIEFQDQLPSREIILKSPDTAPIPDSSGAVITLVFNLLSIVERDTITPIMKYVRRLPAEQQGVFCVNLAKHKTKNSIAFTNAEFTRWAQDNQDIL